MDLSSPIQKSFFEKSSFVLLIIIILFAINNVSFSQGRRDRIGGNINYKLNQQDTASGELQDSLLALDSIKMLPVDSTARIKYFKYVPEYSYGTSIGGKTSPYLLGGSALIAKSIEFDQSGNVVVTESFDGEPIRAPLVVPLTSYLAVVTDKNKNKALSDIVAERFRGNTQDDLSKLFEKFTDITIPLPFKSESIFGPPTFNLKINGAVDITASYQSNTTDQTDLSGFGNSNSSINFKQEVQLTAKGRVGDKLNIDADYNTQRLFDFENQLKLRYDGYADEVIKKIEGGNVSLETRSGLIGSSQALFGVKGDFQLGALALSTVVSQKKSKTEVKDFSFGAQEQAYTIQVWDYSDNHYFLDTNYKQSFLDYYNNSILSTRTDSLQIDDLTFEVWVQADVTFTGYREAGLHVDLERLPQSGRYNDSLKVVPTPIQGLRSYGIVRKLATSEYELNKFAGFVSLKISLPENYFVGVAYRRTVTGEQYGTISTDSAANGNDTLVLKMIKVDNLTPANTLAWEHKLKNIYRLPVSRVARDGFEFDVKFQDNGVYNPTFPPALQINSNLITILGLDKFAIGRTGTPDNKFDYIPGLTIDPENGFVIFPTLKPFLTVLQEYNVDGRTIDSSFWYRDIYTDLKSNSRQKPNGTNYRIEGKARGEAAVSNTINLGFNIVQGSVTIKVGNIELTPNIDYTVDYTTGTVVIRNTSALLSKDLKVSYETNDLFTLASKTFIGMRGDYRISEKSSIGFTFVNLKQETLNDKVRIGEEPTNNSMFGVDFQTEIQANFLTGLVNLLPGFNTRTPSTISVRGELAAIVPDPNTKKSEIPDDNNEAVAY
ncbi:MAG: cell surface protein SprA, partial [Ignavibacteria bacterium]